MQNFLILLFLLITGNSFSQKIVDVGKNLPATSNLFYTVGGEPVNNAKYIRVVEGSAFLNEAWLEGKIILSGGRVYDSIKMRIDAMDNTLHYLTPNGEELLATTPIRSVLFADAVTKKITQFDHSDFIPTTKKNEPGWYQLLDSGLVAIYKLYIKTIRETKPYGSATYEQSIITTNRYYILKNEMLTQVGKFKQIPGMLQDKKTELLEYITSNNLTGRGDADYIALIEYYKSLVKK